MSLPWMNRLDFLKHLFTTMQRKLENTFSLHDVVFLIFILPAAVFSDHKAPFSFSEACCIFSVDQVMRSACFLFQCSAQSITLTACVCVSGVLAGVPVSSRVSAKIQQLVNTLKQPRRPPLREFFVDDFDELLEG